MRIWLINHYAVPPQYYPLARTTNFAKYLMRMGHDVTIFAASSVHNSSINLIENESAFREERVNNIHYVYVKCHSYHGNGAGRIENMFEFAFKIGRVCEKFKKPDAVLASSATPLACMAGLRIAKRYGAKAVAEVLDLWPESFVSFGLMKRTNPALIPMYWFEKKMYEYADEVIFSMKGAYDYIKDRMWEKDIPKSKVHYINNGIDLELFDYNKVTYTIDDEDLNNDQIFKLVYVGSIRHANNLGKLLDVAKKIKNPKIKFLIWGNGDDLEKLQQRTEDEKICNAVFKGYIEKKYIPYITSQADLNIVHYGDMPVGKYGVSPNKLFEYMAAGKPIIDDRPCNYNPLVECDAGIEVKDPSDDNIARAIDTFVSMDKAVYIKYCQNAREGARKYDFGILTRKLLEIMA